MTNRRSVIPPPDMVTRMLPNGGSGLAELAEPAGLKSQKQPEWMAPLPSSASASGH